VFIAAFRRTLSENTDSARVFFTPLGNNCSPPAANHGHHRSSRRCKTSTMNHATTRQPDPQASHPFPGVVAQYRDALVLTLPTGLRVQQTWRPEAVLTCA
jgi:hypothetical protein